MIQKHILAILMIPLLVSCLVGQEYFQYPAQSVAAGTAYPQTLPDNAWNQQAPTYYGEPATPYSPLYPTTPSLSPQKQATLYTAPSYASPEVPAPQPNPYTAPYTAPYATPYSTPSAPTPAAPVAPPVLPPVEETTIESVTSEPNTAEPAAHEAPTEEEEAVDETIPIEEETPTAWYYTPVYWFDLWEGNIELGMSGSHGNTETLDYLLGLDAKRETEEHILDFNLKYDRKSADSVETAHRLFGEIRWELLFEDSRWTWFFHETTDYDEFKAYDMRLSYDTGLGRCLIKNDDTSLLARAGAGFSHEIGSPDEELVPEAVFGLQFSHKLNERQKVSASSEYSPDVTDFLDYRLKSKASWEVLLDEETNLSLKVSLLDRYDSTPYGKKPNDLDYTLTLLWKF